MLESFFKKERFKNRVLIVEDDAMLSKVLADSLVVEKFEIAVVADGLKVMEEVVRFAPNIVLLDLILPGIDGFEILKQLKEDTQTKNIPVVVLSNLSQAGDVKAVKALGADQYFLKANTRLDVIIDYIKKRLIK